MQREERHGIPKLKFSLIELGAGQPNIVSVWRSNFLISKENDYLLCIESGCGRLQISQLASGSCFATHDAFCASPSISRL